MPSAQSFESAAVAGLYARMPTFVKFSCVASHGRKWPVHVKQSAPSLPKMLSCDGPFLAGGSGRAQELIEEAKVRKTFLLRFGQHPVQAVGRKGDAQSLQVA